MAKYYKEINDFLEEKREKKELPSDIKETFINDLIDSQECICGRPIKEGTPEHLKLKTLLKTAGREELDTAYIKISSFINSSETKETVNSFYKKIYAYKKDIMRMDSRIEEIDKRVKEIGLQIKDSDDELITAREEQREKAEEILLNSQIEKGIMSKELKKIENDLKFVTGAISRISAKDKETEIYRKCFDLSNDLKSLNSEIREYFVLTTQEDMDRKLKEVFGNIASKKEREPFLTENFELKIVNRETGRLQLLSTGERQITSLSFIGALVSYARSKPGMQLISDFSGGDYPIVMDSPFGNLDLKHRSSTAEGLPTLASQVVAIVSEGQWKGDVEAHMYKRTGRIYLMQEGRSNSPDGEFTYIKELN